MKKKKIGKGYHQTGYGRGFKSGPIVWLINGKAYVKDANSIPYETDLPGYTMCNPMISGGEVKFAGIGLISNHAPYDEQSVLDAKISSHIDKLEQDMDESIKAYFEQL